VTDLMTTKQVALALGISASSVRNHKHLGHITPEVLGNRGHKAAGRVTPDLYHPDEVERFRAYRAEQLRRFTGPDNWGSHEKAVLGGRASVASRQGKRDAGHASVRILARVAFLLVLVLVATVTAWNSPAGTPVAVLLMVGAYYILGRLLFSGALAAPRRARGGAR